MKFLTLCFLLLATTLSFGQKTRLISNNLGDGIKEVYYVVKTKKSHRYKHGEYHKKTSTFGITLERGLYDHDQKVGKWIYRNSISDPKEEHYYIQGILDSIYGIRGGDTVGIKFENGVEIRRYYFSSKIINSIKRVEYSLEYSRIFTRTKKIGYDEVVLTSGKLKGDKKVGQWIFTNIDSTYAILNYQNGKQVGEQTSYYPDGRHYCTEQYNDSSKRQGTRIIYYQNGDTNQYMSYNNGNLDGLVMAKFSNGQVFCRAKYQNNRLMDYIEYDSSGNQSSVSFVNDGTGTLFHYQINTKGEMVVDETISILEGLPHGKWVSYNQNGDIKYKANYKKGIFLNYEISPEVPKIQNIDTAFPYLSLVTSIANYAQKASYQTAEIDFRRYLAENTNYPKLAMENDISGVVWLMFIINQLGDILKIEVIDSRPDNKTYGLEEESIRVLQMTNGQWHHAHQYGMPVNMRYRLPIRYRLD